MKFDLDLAEATFEYVARKKINEGKLPANKSFILCDEHYYVVDWEGMSIQKLWDKTVLDKLAVATFNEEELENLFTAIIDNFIANIAILDPREIEPKKKLSDLIHWESVKSIPKKYYGL